MNYKKLRRKSQEGRLKKRLGLKKKSEIKKQRYYLHKYLLPENPIIPKLYSKRKLFFAYITEFNKLLSTKSYKEQKELFTRLLKFTYEIEKFLGINKFKLLSGYNKTLKEDICSHSGLISYGFGTGEITITNFQNIKKAFISASNCNLNDDLSKIDNIFNTFKNDISKLYELKKVSYVPFKCRSLFCKYCAWQNTRKRFTQVFTLLKNIVNERYTLSFITLTTKNCKHYEINKEVNKIYRLLGKLYNFKLGKNNLRKIRELALIELGKYLANYYKLLKKRYKNHLIIKHKVFKKKHEHLKILDKTIRYVSKFINKPAKDRRFGIIFPSIWKFEIKKNKYRNDFNLHWHGICLRVISRFFLKAITDYLGFGPILDVRSVKNAKGNEAICELTKYETKDIVSGHNLTFLEKVIINASLTHRKKFRIWFNFKNNKRLKQKLQAIKYKDDDNLTYVVSKGDKAHLELKFDLQSIPKIYRFLRDHRPDYFEKLEIGKLIYPVKSSKIKSIKEISLPISIDKNSKFVSTGRGLQFFEAFLKLQGSLDKFQKALFVKDVNILKENFANDVTSFIKDKLSLSPHKIKKLEQLTKKKKKFIFIDLLNFEESIKRYVLEIPPKTEEQLENYKANLGPIPPPDINLDFNLNIGL
jgi:hypothetical protein